VVVRTRLGRIGTSSVTLHEEIAARAGWVAAEAESVIVARDAAAGRSRPLTESERAALTAVLAPG
jgi:acyl-CoA thioesterase FadM